MLLTLPSAIICILLLFTYFEVEKRKKTELLLNESLSDLTSYQKLLENAAKYDFLTSLVNRRGLLEIYMDQVKKNCKSGLSIIFIMSDIDHFKNINDNYGHAAGDKVLIEISNIIRRKINTDDDVVCRWGGEEFIIMLIGRTYHQAMVLAEEIRKEIEETSIPWENETAIKATMTFGVAEHDSNCELDQTISKADNAMYIGKERGRNRVISYRDLNI